MGLRASRVVCLWRDNMRGPRAARRKQLHSKKSQGRRWLNTTALTSRLGVVMELECFCNRRSCGCYPGTLGRKIKKRTAKALHGHLQGTLCPHECYQGITT